MLKITVKSNKAQLAIEGLRGRMANLRPAFVNFHAYMIRRVTLMFHRLKKGGDFRGEHWDWFAPQYRRQHGTEIPAYGGVPKVRGSGVVLGRLRHSGQRVTRSSSIMQDTGRLRSSALTQFTVSRGGTRVTMDTPVKYAVMQNRLRRFQFFEDPGDVDMLQRFMLRHIEGNA